MAKPRNKKKAKASTEPVPAMLPAGYSNLDEVVRDLVVDELRYTDDVIYYIAELTAAIDTMIGQLADTTKVLRSQLQLELKFAAVPKPPKDLLAKLEAARKRRGNR